MTFEGESTFPQTPKPTLSTNIPATVGNVTENEVKAEELKFKKDVDEKEEDGDGNEKPYLNEEKDSDSFLLYKESIEVLMHAELMMADDFVLPDEDVDEDVGETKDEQTKFRVKPKKDEAFASTTMAARTNVDGVTWRKKHDLAATRQLQCTFAHTKRKLLYG